LRRLRARRRGASLPALAVEADENAKQSTNEEREKQVVVAIVSHIFSSQLFKLTAMPLMAI
jgi:hypothetical protein